MPLSGPANQKLEPQAGMFCILSEQLSNYEQLTNREDGEVSEGVDVAERLELLPRDSALQHLLHPRVNGTAGSRGGLQELDGGQGG